MKSFIRFFAERHMLAYIITIMIILLGLGALIDIPRDVYPAVDFGIVNIQTYYPGASPEDVELNVTNKIEKEIQTVNGIERVSSLSMENVSIIDVFLDIDAKDPDKIKNNVREAVGRVTEFPKEVTDAPLISELTHQSANSIIEVGLTGELTYGVMREQARLFEKKLKKINGVSRLERVGYRAREIKIEVDPDAVEEYQIPMHEIITAIQSRNIRGTTGSFESYTSETDLVTLAQFKEPTEVGDVIVRSTFDGPTVKIKDLAVIKDEFEEQRLLTRVNGLSAITFRVFMKEGADVIRTCDAIKDLIEVEQEQMLEGIELIYSNDTSRYIRNSFDVVLKNGVIGLILVLILLPIFLNFRTAFWVAMGIPVAFLGTVFLIPRFGGYLDTITLSGMILVIGIIVDDAIIIAENISKRRELGDEPIDAAVNGTYEVFKPVITTVLTTFLVFAPMFFMPGVFGKYIIPIPLAISIALFVSLIESVVALPAHLVTGMKRRPVGSTGRTWFKTLSGKYQNVVKRFLRLRYVLVTVFIVLLIVSLWYAGNFMKMVLFPSGMAREFYAVIELPVGTPLLTSSEKMMELEKIIAEIPEDELDSYNTWVGINIMIGAESENYAALSVLLSPFNKRDRSADEIVEEVRIKAEEIQGVEDISFSISTGGPPVGKPISLQIVGSDDDLRKTLADSVASFLGTIDGVKDISRNDIGGKDQLAININYNRLGRLGLTVADIARNVRLAFDGEIVTNVRYGDEDVAFRLIVDEIARKDLDYIDQVLIPNRQGRMIPLKDVASLVPSPGQPDIRHFDGERTVTIEADVVQDLITPLEATNAVLDKYDMNKDWPGIQLSLGGEVFETQESMTGLFRTLVIALLGIFFLLVLLFNSLAQPLLVMAAIPFGITGVIIAFGFHGEPFSFMGIMGIIGLSGVVVNDSLVLVNHINDLKKTKPKVNIIDIISEGTADRLRPIVMTTVTTVAALLPLAYGIGGVALFMAPMALALGWGLIFATPLTLVLVPCLYLIGQDMHRRTKKVTVKK